MSRAAWSARKTSLRLAIHFTGRPMRLRAPTATSDVLGIGEVLGAEAAADIGRDEAHVLGLDAERAGDVVAVDVDVLARDVERVAAARRIELPTAPRGSIGLVTMR